MCGIVGNVLARADRWPDQAILEAMADRLAHRGPDEAGFVLRNTVDLLGSSTVAGAWTMSIDMRTGAAYDPLLSAARWPYL